MAKERNDETRAQRRQREDEEEAEADAEILGQGEKIASPTSHSGSKLLSAANLNKLEDLLTRTDTLIEQLNHLYHMYFTGIEKMPPIERRKQLEQSIQTIQSVQKPTPGILFRSNSLLTKFNVHKDRWDKMLKDLENGKIRRII